MTKKRDFTLRRRKGRPLTPETLMRILEQTEGEKVAKEAYRNLNGEEPPKPEAEEEA